jgi:serine/threonine protein phosphatase PrpC
VGLYQYDISDAEVKLYLRTTTKKIITTLDLDDSTKTEAFTPWWSRRHVCGAPTNAISLLLSENMVVYEWFARFGQVLAPDENYNAEAAEKQPSIWDILAPDPNFSEGSVPAAKQPNAAVSPLTSAVDALMMSPQPQQRKHPELSTPTASPFIPCPSCMQKLCSSCSQKAAVAGSEQKLPPFSTPPPFRGGLASSLQTPRSNMSYSDAEVEGRVLTAARKQAETMTSPIGALKGPNQIIRMCASIRPLDANMQRTLKKELEKKSNRTVLTARSTNMAQICPDGYTPFMAAAYANHVVAAEIIFEFVKNSTDEKVVSVEQLLLETNLQGKTAYHIAAEKGHTEVLRFIQSKHQETFGDEAAVPTDLMGRTPLGAALTSPDPKASVNKGVLMEQLYRNTDKSVRGSPLPAEHRVVYASDERLQMVAGMSEMPGKRIRMEDCTVCKTTKSAVLLAVCDGHDDDGRVSQFVAEGLVVGLDEQRSHHHLPVAAEEWQASCKDICLATDDALRKSKLRGGSVAVLIAVTATQVVVANVGDCRCILVQLKTDQVADLVDAAKQLSLNDDEQGGSDADSLRNRYSVIALSHDHKPDVPEELARIEKAGLTVLDETFEANGETVVIHKINLSEGNRLACSRAFGDFEYKANVTVEAEDQAVIAVPDVIVHARCPEDAFVVAACDGVWDVMTNDDVAKFVAERVEHHVSSGNAVTAAILPTVGDELLVECLNRGSADNMSVVVVALSKTADRVLGLGPASLQGKALDFATAGTATPGQDSNENE